MSIQALARPEIVAMQPYSSARKEAPGRGILLNANELPWSLLDDESEGLNLNRYPDPQPGELVARLGGLYGVAADHLLVTRGSDEGIDLLTRVFCHAGQDAILQSPPTFGMYRIAAQTQGAGVISVPRSAGTDFRLDQISLLEALSQNRQIKLVFLTSPNNPTGEVIENGFVEDLLQATAGRSLVIIDEAYAEFSQRPSAACLLEEHQNLVVLRTLSKAWGAAGLRCGAVLARPAVIDLLRRIIAPYPLSTPVIQLALRILESGLQSRQRQMLQKLAENKARLVDMLHDRSFVQVIWPGEANFVLIRVRDADAVMAHCARRGVILRGFPAEESLRDCIRISVGNDDELTALESALDQWEPDQ